MKRTTRDRHLTPDEAKKYKAMREEIDAEKPKINARIRQRMADQQKEWASQSGDETLGQRIRAAREALGESQVDLARRRGFRRATCRSSKPTNGSQRSRLPRDSRRH